MRPISIAFYIGQVGYDRKKKMVRIGEVSYVEIIIGQASYDRKATAFIDSHMYVL